MTEMSVEKRENDAPSMSPMTLKVVDAVGTAFDLIIVELAVLARSPSR
jgi:hypothetical protein